jgi:hypothetical protein
MSSHVNFDGLTDAPVKRLIPFGSTLGLPRSSGTTPFALRESPGGPFAFALGEPLECAPGHCLALGVGLGGLVLEGVDE